MCINDYIIDRIHEFMKVEDLNQSALARRSSVPPQSIYKVLKGERVATIDFLNKISKGLKCDIQDFFPPRKSLNISIDKDDLYNIFIESLTVIRNEEFASGLSRYKKRELMELVEEFGGWSFLLDYLKEELDIRSKANEEYQLLKESITEDMNQGQVSELKKKIIVSKMIYDQSVRSNEK